MPSPQALRAPQLTPIPEHSPQLVASAPSIKNLSPLNAMTAAVVLPAPGLPLTYYTDIPDEVPAIFSTALRTRSKRKLVQPYPMSLPRSDLIGDVQRYADELWDRYPNEVRRVRETQDWYQMYRYFDAVDLWVEGPVFCFSVIHRLAAMNLDILNAKIAAISEYAQGWVHRYSKRLLNVAEHVPVWNFITPEEIKDEEFDLMTEEEIATVKNQLEYHRHEFLVKNQLVGPTVMVPPPQAHPEVAQPIVPVELGHSSVPPPQTYTNFMQVQRNIHGPPRDVRPRGYSNASDTNRGGRGGRGGNFRYNNFGQHQSARISPEKQEPVYVRSGQRGFDVDSAPRYHTGHRGASLDLTPKPIVPAPSRHRTVSGIVSRPFFSNDARNQISPRRIASEEIGNRSFSGHSRVTSNSSNAVGHSNYHFNGGQQFSNDARVSPPSSNAGHSRDISKSSAGAGHLYQHTCEDKERVTFTEAELESIEYEYSEGANGAVTIYYSGPRRALEHESSSRTVYVGGVSRSLFLNNTLRDMMTECGDVDTISQLSVAPQSFVTFHDDRSVQRAIESWDGSIVEGTQMSVSAARPRTFGPRNRGFSMSSNNRENGFYRGHARNGSENMRYGGYSSNYGDNGFRYGRVRNDSDNSMPNDQHRHYRPEEVRDQQILRPFQPLAPLQDVRNTSPQGKSVTNTYHGTHGVNLKENSPFASPRKNGGETPKKKTGNPKKGSRHSSRQPTPTNSPRKPRSEHRSTPRENPVRSNNKQLASSLSNQIPHHEHLNDLPRSARPPLSERVPQQNQPTTAATQKPQSNPGADATDIVEHVKESALPAGPVHNENNPPSGYRKQAKKAYQKKKRNSVKTGDNASFSTDTSSDTIVSPLSNENLSFLTNPSTNTSFSTSSSRQPSLARTKPRRIGYLDENIELPFDFMSGARKEDEQKVDTSMNETAKVPKTKNKNNRQPSKTANAPEEPARQSKESGHSKKESTSSSTSNPSQRKADVVVKTDHRPTAIMIPPPAIDAVAKTSSDLLTPTPHSATDVMAKKENRPTPADASSPVMDSPKKDAVEIQNVPSPSLLSPVKQLDEQEWPSLNPAKSPVATIADGKPPTPLRAPLMGFLAKVVGEKSPEPKKAPKSIFPPVAVPRSFSGRNPSVQRPLIQRLADISQPKIENSTLQQPASQRPTHLRVLPGDPGSEIWPFVKNFKAKEQDFVE